MIYIKKNHIERNTKNENQRNFILSKCSSWCSIKNNPKNCTLRKSESSKINPLHNNQYSPSISKEKSKNKEDSLKANDYESTFFSNDLRNKYNNLKILFDSKMIEIESLNKLLIKKDNIINDLTERISRLEYLYQFKENNSKRVFDSNYIENSPIAQNDKQSKNREKELRKLKSENLNYKSRIINYEKDLEKFYLKRYEKEISKLKKNYEIKMIEAIEEKEKKNQFLHSENQELREILREYKNSYISLNDHEIILNKLKNDFGKEISNQKTKLDLIQSRRNEESQFLLELETNKNKKNKQKKAYNFINVDHYNSVMESTAKFSYTNTEFKDCIFSTRNKDKSNILIMNNIDLSHLNISKINESKFTQIQDDVILSREDKINSVKSIYPNLDFKK